MSPESNTIPADVQLEIADNEGMFDVKLNEELELRENEVYEVLAERSKRKEGTEDASPAQTNP